MKKLLLLAILLLPLGGCRHVNSSNPAVITAVTLLDADHTCKALEDALTATDHVLDGIATTEPDYYAQVKPLIQRISTTNLAAAHAIQNAKNGGAADWKAALLNVAGSVDTQQLTATGIKNSVSQKNTAAILASLVGLMKGIETSFGGTK